MPDILKDGIYPVYVKDGVMYPVGLTHEQFSVLPMAVKVLSMGDSLRVLFDQPIGKAVNLRG